MRRAVSLILSVVYAAIVVASGSVFAADAAKEAAARTASKSSGSKIGVPVRYTLPTTGPLPRTYRVTLAIVDAKNPDWILSAFLAGAVRTVTAENRGEFTETWDGLDENFMPLPPGEYGVKGIVMPAEKWQVDDEYHTIVPKFVGGPSAWLPPVDQWSTPEPFAGDPVGAPLGDIDVGAGGKAVFYWTYLENGTNQPIFDLNKPIGYDQFIRAFISGGAGGGTSTCTDGENVWSFSTDGGPKFVYRADGKPFGSGRANRPNVYLPEGWVKSMACFRDQTADKTYIYVAQGGRIEVTKGPRHDSYTESDTNRVDKITVHNGADGKILGEITASRPRGIVARGGVLYVLHQNDKDAFVVSSAKLVDGLAPDGLKPMFALPTSITPTDLEVDSRGRIYLSDAAANHVYQLDSAGKLTHTFGRAAGQTSGEYDPQTFIQPGKLATWTDSEGQDRLLVIDDAGPNRVSEWTADGRFVREFITPQTKANDGWIVDQGEFAYIAGQKGWLTRFKIDHQTGAWTINAVWPNVEGMRRPILIRRDGRIYLACRLTYVVYRLDEDEHHRRWVKSAAILREGPQGKNQPVSTWHDANGDGQMQDDEKTKLEMPGSLFRYHGANWLADLSLIVPDMAGSSVWRLAPGGFDSHGNPIFTAWEKALTDPVFEAKKEGKATALFGANELATKFESDWSQVDGSPAEGYYVNARGGRGFSANEGPQYKISRYGPNRSGGQELIWRVGRAALQGLAKPGEIYGTIHIQKPINGLISVVDQSRCGILLYTSEGMYVDTIFLDGRRFRPDKYGVYPQPGEFFAGFVFGNPANGKVYFGMGKTSPMLFEAVGWSLKQNPVQKLTTLDKTVVLTADRTASPPEIALSVRGGAGAAKLARITPAVGGANLDGSLVGWESCDAVQFAADKDRTVEARLLYDPDHLYVRWHVRLGAAISPKPLEPVDRLFAHDRLADTVSLYLQGDSSAPAPKAGQGRPGDVRIVFGVFKDGQQTRPVALGMYPKAPEGVTAHAVTYRTPVGVAEFGHVGLLKDAKLHWVADKDDRGFVLTAGIPRTAIPGLPELGGGLRTTINFEATLAGHNKFWWSNADGSASRETYDEPSEAKLYPGSWAPAQFAGLDRGVVIRRWRTLGPFGGPNFKKLKADPNGPVPGTKIEMKLYARDLAEAAVYPPDDQAAVDLSEKFTGEQLTGYWPHPKQIGWKLATLEDLDTRVKLGLGGQVYYGVSWVHVPEDMELNLKFQGHRMTTLRWFINGERIKVGPYRETQELHRSEAEQAVTLKAGWNEIRFRGYCVGYVPFRAGLVLDGPEERLWKVRLADEPPKK